MIMGLHIISYARTWFKSLIMYIIRVIIHAGVAFYVSTRPKCNHVFIDHE